MFRLNFDPLQVFVSDRSVNTPCGHIASVTVNMNNSLMNFEETGMVGAEICISNGNLEHISQPGLTLWLKMKIHCSAFLTQSFKETTTII
jgi:hypothetical protein